ncbi:hypothetical protein Tco_0471687, partial [Tanacetum coccineum]
MRGYEGASIACPRSDEGAIKCLISMPAGVHELCHAVNQPGGDSRLLSGKALDDSSQTYNITP